MIEPQERERDVDRVIQHSYDWEIFERAFGASHWAPLESILDVTLLITLLCSGGVMPIQTFKITLHNCV